MDGGCYLVKTLEKKLHVSALLCFKARASDTCYLCAHFPGIIHSTISTTHIQERASAAIQAELERTSGSDWDINGRPLGIMLVFHDVWHSTPG